MKKLPSVLLIDVTKRFGRIVAIDRVTLEIKDGEYVCVLGPTGSGKTTLLKLIAGLVKPDEGEIRIGGKPVDEVPPQERGTVYVPQDYALFPHMKVIDNVAFGPICRGVEREEAYKMAMKTLKMMRLDWRADSYPHELSGGMQQRVALARGLASGAEILLLDEPLGALDARLRLELRYKLRDLVKDLGLTAIHVTHDQEEAMAISDRIIVLRRGRIQQQGTPFNVYRRPSNLFVANFIGGANFLEGIVTERDSKGSWVALREGIKVRTEDPDRLPGESVVVVVREEKVKVLKDEVSGTNLLRGRVVSSRFLGPFIRYGVRLTNGDVVRSRMLISKQRKSIPVNEEVYVYFEPRDAVVYQYPPLGLYKELEVI
ncbi:ABC transporter ATP-binding protein [Candidatus Bathyarchaeota archaeon]|nr:MAG: ABC transporter ATP-binding protein [Candidatus Bathyarchaeota archaeon]